MGDRAFVTPPVFRILAISLASLFAIAAAQAEESSVQSPQGPEQPAVPAPIALPALQAMPAASSTGVSYSLRQPANTNITTIPAISPPLPAQAPQRAAVSPVSAPAKAAAGVKKPVAASASGVFPQQPMSLQPIVMPAQSASSGATQPKRQKPRNWSRLRPVYKPVSTAAVAAMAVSPAESAWQVPQAESSLPAQAPTESGSLAGGDIPTAQAAPAPGEKMTSEPDNIPLARVIRQNAESPLQQSSLLRLLGGLGVVLLLILGFVKLVLPRLAARFPTVFGSIPAGQYPSSPVSSPQRSPQGVAAAGLSQQALHATAAVTSHPRFAGSLANGAPIQILATTPLGQGREIHWVRVNDREMVVATTPNDAFVLSEFDTSQTEHRLLVQEFWQRARAVATPTSVPDTLPLSVQSRQPARPAVATRTVAAAPPSRMNSDSSASGVMPTDPQWQGAVAPAATGAPQRPSELVNRWYQDAYFKPNNGDPPLTPRQPIPDVTHRVQPEPKTTPRLGMHRPMLATQQNSAPAAPQEADSVVMLDDYEDSYY